MTGSRTILGGRERRERFVGFALVCQASAVGLAFLAVALELPLPVEIAGIAVGALGIAAAIATLRVLTREDDRQRRQAQDTIDLAGSMLIAIDADGIVESVNPAACDVLGRPAEDLVGGNLQDRVLHADDRTQSREVLAQIKAGQIDSRTYRVVRTVVRPDGGLRRVEFHAAPRHDRRGELVGLLLSGEDVTVRDRQEERRRRESRDLEQLRRLAQDVAAHDDARDAVVERVRTLLDAGFVTLAEPGDGGTFRFTATTHPALAGRTIRRQDASGCFVVLETGQALLAADAAHDVHVNPAMLAETGCVSLRYEPVRHAGRVIGVLVAGWVERAPSLDERREQLLALAADEASIALVRVATLHRLEAIALTDPLTGVANRRAFDAELARAIARAVRDGKPLSLAVLDLNEFKALNDRSGHDIGDAVLAACAGSWEAELRAGDLLARLGGDEFAVVLPDCDERAAGGLKDRLHAATPHNPGAGIGFATWHGESAFELYQLADRALYRDKGTRRERRLSDPQRVAAVEAAAPWHGDTSAAIEAIAAEARELLDMPNVYVNLVGADELRHAVRPEADPIPARPTSESYCQHVVASGRPFVVRDSADEPALAGNPNAGMARAYAGMPLADAEGNVLGALCAMDEQPRRWEATELRILDRLALRVARELDASAAPASR